MKWLILLGLAGGCRTKVSDAFDTLPRRWDVADTLRGPSENGYGAAVAWLDGEPIVGAPWHGPGRLYGSSGVLLEGQDADRLGEALLGGAELWVGAPGRGDGGAVLRGLSGQVVEQGEAGEGLGRGLAEHDAGVVALSRRGYRPLGSATVATPTPTWSILSINPSRDSPVNGTILLGYSSGSVGLAEASTTPRPTALGRSMLRCDLDQDGDDDVVIGDPLAGRVQFYVIDSMGAFDVDQPTFVQDLGPGAGFALGCVKGGVLVGAPDRPGGGAVAWLREPLTSQDVTWIEGEAKGKLGHSISVGPGRVLIGDPGLGQAWILSQAR
ncbi:MAG: hypothetical protein AB8H79_15235 [Myxococcota bacterium]